MNAFHFAMSCPQCRAGCSGCSFKTMIVVDARVFLRNVAAAGALATAAAVGEQRSQWAESFEVGNVGAMKEGEAYEQRLALARQRRGTAAALKELGKALATKDGGARIPFVRNTLEPGHAAAMLRAGEGSAGGGCAHSAIVLEMERVKGESIDSVCLRCKRCGDCWVAVARRPS